MLRNIIGPVLVLTYKNVFFVAFLLVFQKSSSFCSENEISKKGPVLTYKKAKFGPVFNCTAYMLYISIYIYTL